MKYYLTNQRIGDLGDFFSQIRANSEKWGELIKALDDCLKIESYKVVTGVWFKAQESLCFKCTVICGYPNGKAEISFPKESCDKIIIVLPRINKILSYDTNSCFGNENDVLCLYDRSWAEDEEK